MPTPQTLIRTLMLLTLLLVSVFAMAKEKPPEYTEEGLKLVKDSDWALVYVEPGADFSIYDRVKILDTYVAFKKNWKRDQNRSSRSIRVTDQEMDRIKTGLAKEFDEVFREVLSENDGYEIVDESASDVLLLRPAIVNLDVSAPDTRSAGRSYTFSESAGEMTIYLEIHDSVTGDLIAKGMDRKADRNSGFMTWQTSVSNSAAARRILRGWAQSLRDGLDEAHKSGPAAAE